MHDPKSIILELEKYTNNSYLTHNLHPYPAKFIPQIPSEIINKLTDEGDCILDPFCGSGTTLVECRLLGRNALGLDINPLACLIAKVKTTELDRNDFTKIHDFLNKIQLAEFEKTKYPLPNYHNINFWFKDFVQKELALIYYFINEIERNNAKDFLLVAFSAIIVKVSNQESDTRYKSINKKIKSGDTIKIFQCKVIEMIKRMVDFQKLIKKSKVNVLQTDATTFEGGKNTFDLVITSPPYLNSYDYYLYHKHRMLWLEMDYKFAQEFEFGSRNKHNDKGLGLDHYNFAIKKNAEYTKKMLKKNAYYCVIVGDGILKGEIIKMNKNFDNIFLNLGFIKNSEMSFEQRKYTRSFTHNFRNEYKESYLLIYQNI